MAIIRVPKPPASAYNPERPAGTLLRRQLEHLEWAVRPAAERGPDKLRLTPVVTEADAAARIAALTALLHRQTIGKPPLADTLPLPQRGRARKKGRKAGSKRKSVRGGRRR
jgi:hypothetical protein